MKEDLRTRGKAIKRDKFKVTFSTKVFSNHFIAGHRHSQCRTPTTYMEEYDVKEPKATRPPPKMRTVMTTTRKRTRGNEGEYQVPKKHLCDNPSESSEDQETISFNESKTNETPVKSQHVLKLVTGTRD